MKKLIGVLLLMLLVFPFALAQNTMDADESNSDKIDIYFFHKIGCSYCRKLEGVLHELEKNYPINIVSIEASSNKTGVQTFIAMGEAYNFKIEGYPTTFINNKAIGGAGSFEIEQIEYEINYCMEYECISPSDVLEGKVDINNLPSNVKKDGNYGIYIFLGLILIFALLVLAAFFISKPKNKIEAKEE